MKDRSLSWPSLKAAGVRTKNKAQEISGLAKPSAFLLSWAAGRYFQGKIYKTRWWNCCIGRNDFKNYRRLRKREYAVIKDEYQKKKIDKNESMPWNVKSKVFRY